MELASIGTIVASAGIGPIIAGAAGGFLRSGVGYLKNRSKHGDKFEVFKFSKTIVLMTALGGVVGVFMTSPDPVFVGAVAMSGGVILDALVAILVGQKSAKS